MSIIALLRRDALIAWFHRHMAISSRAGIHVLPCIITQNNSCCLVLGCWSRHWTFPRTRIKPYLIPLIRMIRFCRSWKTKVLIQPWKGWKAIHITIQHATNHLTRVISASLAVGGYNAILHRCSLIQAPVHGEITPQHGAPCRMNPSWHPSPARHLCYGLRVRCVFPTLKLCLQSLVYPTVQRVWLYSFACLQPCPARQTHGYGFSVFLDACMFTGWCSYQQSTSSLYRHAHY